MLIKGRGYHLHGCAQASKYIGLAPLLVYSSLCGTGQAPVLPHASPPQGA